MLQTLISRAQIIYEPVQYQYGDQNRFFYGGSDARIIARAAFPSDDGAIWGRVNGFDFASGDVRTHREVDDQPFPVYSDAYPGQNAAIYGFTASDAANVANASVPRYFRKADVAAVASRAHGVVIIPAQASLAAAPVRPATKTPPCTQPVLILPIPSNSTPQGPLASDKAIVASR